MNLSSFGKGKPEDKDLDNISEDSFNATTRRTSVASSSSSASGNSDQISLEDDEEQFANFYEGLGWKQIVFIQFNDLWRYTLMVTILIHYYRLIYSFHFNNQEREMVIYTKFGTLLLIAMETMYLFDTVLAIVYRNWKNIYKLNVNLPRPISEIIMDVIAVLPIEFIYWAASASEQIDLRIDFFQYLSIHSLIRIYRIFYFFSHARKNVGYNNVVMRVLEMIAYFLLLCHMSSAILFVFKCGAEDDDCFYPESDWGGYFTVDDSSSLSNNMQWYVISLYVIVGRMTFKGFAEFQPVRLVKLLFMVVCLLSIIITFGFIVGHIISALIEDMHDMFSFADRLELIKKELMSYRVSKETFINVIMYYELLWEKRRGVRQKNLQYDLFPNILQRDLNLDIFGDVFKRSHFLKTMDESFLSYLALKMKAKFYLAGNIIFKKGEPKTRMVYLVSGIIQILSLNDDESPIISFSGGTILSEISLLMHCTSSVVVRCATFCEVQVLERKDFHAVLRKHTDAHLLLRRQLQERVDRARELKDIAATRDTPVEEINIQYATEDEVSSVKWFKKFLYASFERKKGRKRGPTSHLLHFRNFDDDVEHTVQFMDLYVISNEYELRTETIWLITTCPWVLRPKTVILKTWDNVIVVTVLFVALVLPYFAFFTNTYPEVLELTMYLVYGVYVGDILIQVSTAVQTKTELIVEWKRILFSRIGEFGFILDVFAAIPFEAFVVILYSRASTQLSTIFMLNKLVKLWKVEEFFQGLQAHRLDKRIILKEIKYLLYLILFIYYGAGISYAQSCFNGICDPNGWYAQFNKEYGMYEESKYHSLVLSCYFSAMIIMGSSISSVFPTTVSDYLITIIIMLTSYVFVVYIICSTAAMEILTSNTWSMFQEKYNTIMRHMKDHKLDSKLQHRVISYLEFCLMHDGASSLLYGKSPLYDLPLPMREEIFGPTLEFYLNKIPIFRDGDQKFKHHLASVCDIILLQPNEVVIYSGDRATCAYIIMYGYCQTLSRFSRNKFMEIMEPTASFNFLEMLMELPNINSVRTLTCCQIIVIEYNKLLGLLVKYPDMRNEVNELIQSCSGWRQIPNLREANYKTVGEVFRDEKSEVVESWFKFNFSVFDPASAQLEAAFLKPYMEIKYFSIVRYLLLRRTLVPDCWFLIGWEISRLSFACISALLFPAVGALELVNYPWVFYIKYVLDFTAYVDMYMRLHVAYYDYRGLIVSHPRCTSAYYLKHAFCLDLLAVFPFEVFTRAPSDMYYYLHFNRVLQVYRIIIGFNFLTRHATFARNYRSVLSAAGLTVLGLIFFNAVGGLLLLSQCSYVFVPASPDLYEPGVECGRLTMLGLAEVEKPISPGRAFLYFVLWTAVIVCRGGLPGAKTNDNGAMVSVIIISLVGFWLIKYAYAKSIAIRTSKDVGTSAYQEMMKALLKFISTKKVKNSLRGEVIKYFELAWKRKHSKDAYETFDTFHDSLKEDVLVQVYGRCLLECQVLEKANRSFFRDLLLNCHTEIFLRGSTILRPYEEVSKVYFVNKGKVDVMVAGYVKGCPTLTIGCILGNLTNALHFCHNLTVVAREHVEMLVMPSGLFVKHLAPHPTIQKGFEDAAQRETLTYFVVSSGKNSDAREDSLRSVLDDDLPSRSGFTMTGVNVLKFLRKTKVFKPQTFLVHVIEWIIVVTSYLTFILTTYQCGYFEIGVTFLVIQYFLDLIFIAKIYMMFSLAYYDENGYLVKDPQLISHRYTHSLFGFVYDFISVVPIELIAFATSGDIFVVTFVFLRSLRILRIAYVIRFFIERHNMLSINVFMMKYGFIAVWFSITIHCTSLIYNLARCISQGDWLQEKDKPWDTKLGDYYTSLFVIISMMFGATLSKEVFAINGQDSIIFCIVVLLLSQLVIAIFIGETCAILATVNRTMSRYMQKLKQLWKFYQINDLSPSRMHQLWRYLSLLWQLRRGQQVPALLEEAPYYIREAIKNSLYGDYVNPNEIFSTCHDDFLRQMITCLQQYIFFPEDYITFTGDVDDTMYFIYSGEVEFLSPGTRYDEEEIKGILVEGQVFGMTQGLYPNSQHRYIYRARTVTVLLTLNRIDWESMLKSFPAVKREIFGKATTMRFK